MRIQIPAFTVIIIQAILASACDGFSVRPSDLLKPSGSSVAYYLEPEWAAPGELVIVHGSRFREGMQLTIGESVVSHVLLSSEQLSFIMPDTQTVGPVDVGVLSRDKVLTDLSVWARPTPIANEAFSELTASDVCQGVFYSTSEGENRIGEKICADSIAVAEGPKACSATLRVDCVTNDEFPALDKERLKANPLYHASLSLEGTNGSIPVCKEGEASCYVPGYSLMTQPLKAIDVSPILPAVIKQGSTLASVSGSLIPTPSDCAADAATDCRTVADFPAIDKALLSSKAAVLRDDRILGGVAGTLAVCADNASNCYLPTFDGTSNKRKAINYDSLDPTLIKNGVTISDILGTLLITDPDCNTDGQLGCLATAAAPAVDAASANTNKAKFDSSLTIASIQGTLTACNSDGDLDCTTGSNFPALDLAHWNSKKSLARSGLSLASVSGTLADCAANASACFLPAYALGSQPLKAISFDSLSAPIIKSGSTIAGIGGSLLEAPANCGSDGDPNCVAISTYPAVDKNLVDTNKTRIHATLALGGVSGTLANCTSDGHASCLTSSNFPAVDKNLVDTSKGKVHSTLTLGGIAGTMADCSADAQLSCQAQNNYPAVDKNTLDAQKSKIRSPLSLAGVVGTMGACAANGSNCFLPAYVVATQSLKAIHFDSLNANFIKQGTSISTVNGSVVEAPLDCALDGATSCVTVADFPAMNYSTINTAKAKIQSTLSLGGVTGTAVACNADGAIACTTNSSFPSLNQGYLNTNKALVHTTVSIAGISGTLASCTANGSNCFLPAYSAGTQNLKAINYNGLSPAVIKNNQVIADVTGSMQEAPAACLADADVSCTTDTNFPAVNKANIETNKAKILPTLTVGGVVGTLATCALDAATSCLTDASFPAFDRVTVDAAKAGIRSSLTIGGITGTLDDCAANGSNCFLPTYAATTQPLKAISFDSLSSSIIKDGSSISTVTGNVLEAAANCSADAQIDCVAISNFPAVDKNDINTNKAKMHTSLTAGGIAGTLPNCTTDGGLSCLTTTTYPALQISNINSNLASIHSTVAIGAVSGTMGSCTALGSACYIPPYVASTQPLKAIDQDSFTAAVIKKGTTLAGVLGDYPSSSNQLSPGDAHADFTAGSFSTQIKSATTYGWFNSAGVRASKTGDSDITAANIRTGVSIFSLGGSFTVPDSWDIRAGTTVSTATSGKLKASCRNPSNATYWETSPGRLMTLTASTDLVTYNAHGFSNGHTVRIGYTAAGTAGLNDTHLYYVRDVTTNTFKLSTTLNGTVFDITADMTNFPVYRSGAGDSGVGDGIDFYNFNQGAATGAPFGTNYLCSGISTSASSPNVWKDVTTSSCGGSDCRYKDQITQMEWTEVLGSTYWTDAMRLCKDLSYDGKSDWRLPTHAEVLTAYEHGIYTATSANWAIGGQIWTATKKRSSGSQAWFANLASGGNGSDSMSKIYDVQCVRKDGEDY